MATLFHSFTISFFFFFLLLSAVQSRSPTTSSKDEAHNAFDLIHVPHSNSKILLPTEKPLETGPGSVVNIDVDSQKNRKDSGKLADEVTVMPASGSFPGKIVNGGKEKEFSINGHLDRMRVIRRSFPVHCRHRRSRLDGGFEIRQREKDLVGGERRHHHRRFGKIVSARWIDGTTFHQVDTVTIPDVYGEGMMIGEFRSPRFIFRRHHDHRKEGKGQVLWRKIRKFLINL